MKKLILFLLIPSIAFAEPFVCYDAISKRIIKRVGGDCKTLGLCTGPNYDGLLSNCIVATQEEYNKAGEKYVKFDGNVVSGSRIVDMDATEKNLLDAEEAQTAADAEAARLAALDTKISNAKVSDAVLTKIDTAIDNIATLADAKVFLKKLARYLVAK